MKGLSRSSKETLRYWYEWLDTFGTDTINIARRAYLGSLILTLVAVPVLSAMGWLETASGICFFATILLSILGHIFDARVLIGAAGYKWLRRILRMSMDGSVIVGTPGGKIKIVDERPYLGKIFYWSSFANMWPSMVTALLGVLVLWGISFLEYIAVLSFIFLMLWAVATQTEIGKFWRQVHIATTTVLILGMLFVIFNYGWFHRIIGEHRRSQNASMLEEKYQHKYDTTFAPQLDDINGQLVTLRYNMSQLVVAGKPIPDSMHRQEHNLETGRQYVQSQVDTYAKKAQDVANKSSSLGAPFMAFLCVLLLGSAFWALDELGAFKKSASAGSGSGGH